VPVFESAVPAFGSDKLLVGLLPVTISYLYHFPVGVFWTGQVIELAGEGLANAYTSGIAIAFVTGGVGLLGLWIALVSRLIGRAVSNRLILVGVSVAILLGVSLVAFLLLAGGWWWDYFLVGAPLLVAIAKDDRLFLIVADLESQDLRPSLWGSFR
jgi:hypothetical protein